MEVAPAMFEGPGASLEDVVTHRFEAVAAFPGAWERKEKTRGRVV